MRAVRCAHLRRRSGGRGADLAGDGGADPAAAGCAGVAHLWALLGPQASQLPQTGRMHMAFGRRTMWAAVLAGVVGASGARAAEPDSPEQTTNQESTASSPPPAERSPFGEKYYPASPQAQRGLLMSQLDRAGVAKPLDNARIRIFGHVEAGYTYNP